MGVGVDHQSRDEVLQRLRSIEGHVRAVQRMLEEDRCCLEVIRQTLAIRRALDRVSQLLVSSHVRDCLSVQGSGGTTAEHERVIQELLQVLELSNRP